MQQAFLLIEEAVQDLVLKLNNKLDLTTKEQIALPEDVQETTDGFNDWLTALENRIDHLERSRAPCRSEPAETRDLLTTWVRSGIMSII